MTKTFTTSQVIRHLERQPELVFEACKAPGKEVVQIYTEECGRGFLRVELRQPGFGWIKVPLQYRSDWELSYGAILPTRRRIQLGTVDLGNTTKGTLDLTLPRTVALSDDICAALRRTGKRWNLVAVEVI